MASFEETFEEQMINNEISGLPNTNNISDGYHTFGELYEHRFTLWMALCQNSDMGWKSLFHSDGSNFEGWFVLGMGKISGEQMTYHLPMSKWDDCRFAQTLEKAPEFDGHTSEDVLERVKKFFIS